MHKIETCAQFPIGKPIQHHSPTWQWSLVALHSSRHSNPPWMKSVMQGPNSRHASALVLHLCEYTEPTCRQAGYTCPDSDQACPQRSRPQRLQPGKQQNKCTTRRQSGDSLCLLRALRWAREVPGQRGGAGAPGSLLASQPPLLVALRLPPRLLRLLLVQLSGNLPDELVLVVLKVAVPGVHLAVLHDPHL